jgi:hypothetical protein
LWFHGGSTGISHYFAARNEAAVLSGKNHPAKFGLQKSPIQTMLDL